MLAIFNTFCYRLFLNNSFILSGNNLFKEYNVLKYILIHIFIILFSSSFCFAQNIQIIDGWYYINGKKFFVKGIGYETHTRPGQVPWIYSFDSDLIEFDLNRIKNAGFNTIRTWGALSEEELKIIEESGLKILFGIWIDPHGDFSNESFITEAYNHVNDVLNYSVSYNSIIGYLIMNEPQVQHIYDVGAQSLSDLWQSLIDLIHNKHPGVPISFSNTMIGDYINMEIFDFAAYNAYIYNPVTISQSHGYAGYLRFLKQNRAIQIPFIITEYGLSVSPGPPNNEYGYGGNSLEQQTSGNLFMYRELIDAGAQGNCVFQYHDGWWKGDDEYSHDPSPEEWFGLIEFSSIGDIYGTPRPVWAAFEKYNMAIITNPKNEHIYQNDVPIEFFTTSEVASYSISKNDSVLISESLDGTYYTNELILALNEEIKDIELVFDFFNSNDDILKSETISILYSDAELGLPEIAIEVSPENIVPGSPTYLNMHVTTNPQFSIEDNTIHYVLHPHIGFDPGIAKSMVMSFTDNNWSYLDYFDIPQETKVVALGAGFMISYGKFKKRISNQKILIYEDWADPIAAPELRTGIKMDQKIDRSREIKLYQNFPNPFGEGHPLRGNPMTNLQYRISKNGFVNLTIYTALGREIKTLINQFQNANSYSIEFDAGELSSGVYFYKLQVGNEYSEIKKMILIK